MIDDHDKLELQLSFGPKAQRIMALSLASAFIIWLLIGVVPHYLPHDWVDPLGDTYSAVSALFGGLAFAGVVVTILLQSMELRMQRQELAESREELKRSATAQERSEQMLFLSAYMNTCSSLLDGYGRMFQQSEGGMRRVWYLAHSDLTAYVDALRQQVADKGFPELVALSQADVIRGRVARIAYFVESQLVMIDRAPTAEQGAKAADVLETARQLITATRCMLEPQNVGDPALIAALDDLLDDLGGLLKPEMPASDRTLVDEARATVTRLRTTARL